MSLLAPSCLCILDYMAEPADHLMFMGVSPVVDVGERRIRQMLCSYVLKENNPEESGSGLLPSLHSEHMHSQPSRMCMCIGRLGETAVGRTLGYIMCMASPRHSSAVLCFHQVCCKVYCLPSDIAAHPE